MNKFSKKLINRSILKAKNISISPLEMNVKQKKKIKKSLAINEVSILRQSRQAANLSVKKYSKYLIKKLVSDGILYLYLQEARLQPFSSWPNFKFKF